MRKTAALLLLLLPFCLTGHLHAQQANMRIKKGPGDHATVSFEFVNNLIIIPVRINQSDPMYFILDSGVRNTMITRLFAEDTLNINEAEKVDIMGHGTGQALKAYRSTNNTVDIGRVHGENFSINVLLQDIFHLSSQLGKKVHGIIGYDLLRHFIVHVNYQSRQLKFYPRENFDKWWVRWFYDTYPIEVYNEKPYIKMWVQMRKDSPRVPVNMLIDTGSSETLWLFERTNSLLTIPERKEKLFIGRGLNGNIFGWRSRIFKLGIGGRELRDPIVAFPDTVSVRYDALREGRNGTIGADILHRFNLILDYSNKKIYMRRNSNFPRAFRHNTTGIVLYAEVPGLPIYKIRHVRQKSNASRSGLKRGDQIIRLNGKYAVEHSLEEMNKFLNKVEPGEKISLLIMREAVEKKVRFKAEDIIGSYKRK